nr:TlyA family RNA methyltransferase [Kineosphaera limosa]
MDVRLVGSGLARSRSDARELIDARRVLVDGRVTTKPARQVTAADRVEVTGDAGPRPVGRAAGKLSAAFEAFGPRGLSADGHLCLDVGASTGGFTQTLLACGAAHVVALDVGHGQLVPQLADDPRVTELSGTNIRDVDPAALRAAHGPFTVIVADLSFISLRLVLPQLVALLADGSAGSGQHVRGQAVLLIKPQFEVGRGGLDKHGVVKDPEAGAAAAHEVVRLAEELGWTLHDLADSPILGANGNREYLGWFSTT